MLETWIIIAVTLAIVIVGTALYVKETVSHLRRELVVTKDLLENAQSCARFSDAEVNRLRQYNGGLLGQCGRYEMEIKEYASKCTTTENNMKKLAKLLDDLNFEHQNLLLAYNKLVGDPTKLRDYEEWLSTRSAQESLLALIRGGSDDQDAVNAMNREESAATVERINKPLAPNTILTQDPATTHEANVANFFDLTPLDLESLEHKARTPVRPLVDDGTYKGA